MIAREKQENLLNLIYVNAEALDLLIHLFTFLCVIHCQSALRQNCNYYKIIQSTIYKLLQRN